MTGRRVSEAARGKREGEQDVERRKGGNNHDNKEREREQQDDRTEQYEHLMLGRFIPA